MPRARPQPAKRRFDPRDGLGDGIHIDGDRLNVLCIDAVKQFLNQRLVLLIYLLVFDHVTQHSAGTLGD
jgi:hypothetical protein